MLVRSPSKTASLAAVKLPCGVGQYTKPRNTMGQVKGSGHTVLGGGETSERSVSVGNPGGVISKPAAGVSA